MRTQNSVVSILATALVLSLSACGFTLKGYQSQMAKQPLHSINVVAVGNNVFNIALKQQLLMSGYTTSSTATKTVRIIELKPYRNELSGRIAEVQLGLTAVYLIENNGVQVSEPYTATARRQYQYDVQTLNLDNQLENVYINDVNNDVAQQIAKRVELSQ